MRQEFAETVAVEASAEEAWTAVSDIVAVLGWISIVEEAKFVEAGSYTAVLRDRMGPFKLRADLSIDVEADAAAREIRARAAGEDRQIGSRLSVDVRLKVDAVDGGSVVDVRGAYEVTGRPASLGAASIRKKAGKIIAEFFANVGRIPTAAEG